MFLKLFCGKLLMTLCLVVDQLAVEKENKGHQTTVFGAEFPCSLAHTQSMVRWRMRRE